MKYNKELIGILNTLNNLNKSFENNKLRIFSSNRIHNSKFTFFRYIVSSEELKKYSLRDIFVNYFNKAEKFFPGSSYFLSKEIVNIFYSGKSFYKNKLNIKENTLENVLDFLRKNINTDKTIDLLKNTLEVSGPNTTLSCKVYNGNEILVSNKKNSKFNVCIEESFSHIYFNNVKETTKTLQACVMDAYIERESELIPLIDYAHLKKIPTLVFCRGISSNSISALKNIIVKNNIYVYPYVIKFDNNDPFILKDIASALGTKIVSAETGDSIYKDSIEKSIEKEIKLSSSFIEIKNPITDEVKEINEVISKTSDFNLKKYLYKRKARFSSNITEISIPKENIEILSEIKNLIRCYNHAAAFGIVEFNNVNYSKSCFDYVFKLSESMFETINNIGFVVKTSEG